MPIADRNVDGNGLPVTLLASGARREERKWTMETLTSESIRRRHYGEVTARERGVVQVTRLMVGVALIASFLVGAMFMPNGADASYTGLTMTQIRHNLAYEVVTREVKLSAGETRAIVRGCPRHKEILGGGAAVVHEGSGDFHTVLQESSPGSVGTGNRHLWFVEIRNDDSVDHMIGVWAICADMRLKSHEI
jgi:hypothetical protein